MEGGGYIYPKLYIYIYGVYKLQILNLKHQTLNPQRSEQVKISMAAAKKKPKLQMDAKVPPTPIYI